MGRRIADWLLSRFCLVHVPSPDDEMADCGMVKWTVHSRSFAYRLWRLGGVFGLWRIPAVPAPPGLAVERDASAFGGPG